MRRAACCLFIVSALYVAGCGSWPGDTTPPNKIIFRSERDGNSEIYIMNADGSGQTRLTNNSADDNTAVFNPAGTRIAFQSDRTGNVDIFLMNPDGADVIARAPDE